MSKPSIKSAVLIILAVSIQPASAQMWRGANFRPSSFQHQGFRSMTFSPYRLGLPAQSVRDFRPQSLRNSTSQTVRNLSSQRASNIAQKVKPFVAGKDFEKKIKQQEVTTFPQSTVSPYGPSGNAPLGASSAPPGASSAPQGVSYSLQGVSGTRQGATSSAQGVSYGQPQSAAQSGSNSQRAVSHCALSGGETCPTLNPPGSRCECRDNFGRHFRGVAQ
jgi:hypothetical protein